MLMIYRLNAQTTLATTTTTEPPTTTTADDCGGLTIKALKVPNGKINPKWKYPMGGISARTMITRYQLFSNKLWNKKYLGYITFTRQMCGSDFIKKMAGYQLNVEVQDKSLAYALAEKSAMSKDGVTLQF